MLHTHTNYPLGCHSFVMMPIKTNQSVSPAPAATSQPNQSQIVIVNCWQDEAKTLLVQKPNWKSRCPKSSAKKHTHRMQKQTKRRKTAARVTIAAQYTHTNLPSWHATTQLSPTQRPRMTMTPPDTRQPSHGGNETGKTLNVWLVLGCLLLGLFCSVTQKALL